MIYRIKYGTYGLAKQEAIHNHYSYSLTGRFSTFNNTVSVLGFLRNADLSSGKKRSKTYALKVHWQQQSLKVWFIKNKPINHGSFLLTSTECFSDPFFRKQNKLFVQTL